MRTDFNINFNRRKDGVHLRLRGDFDGNSACELINKLKENTKATRIFIHTEGLNRVHSFGRDVLDKNLPFLKIRPASFVLTGPHSYDICSNEKVHYKH